MLFEAFPNKVIKHTGRPDYETLNNIKTALKRNFATVLCTLGGGIHGYLGTVLTAAEYAAATPNNTLPFIDPFSPALPPSSHPTALDHKSPQQNANSTRHYDNGPNIKIRQMHEKSSSRTESTICT